LRLASAASPAPIFTHVIWKPRRASHRIRVPSSELARYETTWLQEEVETGALHRMMQNPPPPDNAGITWTSWRDHQ
jgi:hypothetical protein